MSQITKIFKKLKKRPALIPYLTAGYPDLKTTGELILALARGSADIIELGVPFSDPVADGPIIQKASQDSLAKGISLKKILEFLKNLQPKISTPIVLMSYFNPILAFGLKNFFKVAAQSGAAGVIIPDLPVEEGRELSQLAKKSGVDLIFLAAPTTNRARLKKIISLTEGYLYYVSLTGVTGIRRDLPAGLLLKLKELQKICRKPVAVGFGFSNPAQIKKIRRQVDAVIVGSALVKIIESNLTEPAHQIVPKVVRFCRKLKSALK